MCNCRKDLEPGLHISRLGREDFAQFFRLARTMTAFVRIKQVTITLALHVQRKADAVIDAVHPINHASRQHIT